jgi:hypothetical protein
MEDKIVSEKRTFNDFIDKHIETYKSLL